MRLAAFYAGLTLNALFFGYAADLARGRGDTVALVAAPLVWGMFLLFGAYWVPAQTGLGPRELVEAQLGRWVGGFVLWVWLPLWAVSWYGDLTSTFLYTVHAPFFRWEEAGRASVDTRIAVAWPWVVLTALTGPAPVRISAAILLALPFAFREEWRWVWTATPEQLCCGGTWGMQDLTLWLAPALLFAGRFPERRMRDGVMGIVAPLVLAVLASSLTELGARRANWVDAATGFGSVGVIKMLLLSFTLLAAGRFCVSLFAERLGEWRRWWVVLPMTAGLVWAAPMWPYRWDWAHWASPFLALSGVMSAGYLRRPGFVFSKAEQWVAGAVWVGAGAFGVVTYHNDFSVPLLTWLLGFGLTWAGLRYLNVAVATPLR